MPHSRTELHQAAGHIQQWGGTRLVTLEDGSERGVRAVEFRTAAGLEFATLVDRAMDIAWCRFRGKSIAWHSPTGFVGPWYREPQGLGFLRSFGGGLFATGGLDHILFPEDDDSDTYNYPGRTHAEYGLHGRASSTPAILRGYGEHWNGDECELTAEGEVRQAGAMAENLVLSRRISTTLNGKGITWEDEVTNVGHYPTPHMLLYHVNIGAPLLDPSCELVAPIRAVRDTTPSVSGDPEEHLRFLPPTPGFIEQAYSHEMAPGNDGMVTVGLINRAEAEPWGIALRYESERFPYFFQWRYFDAGTYVLGLEPSTNGLTGRQGAREADELTILEPGERRTYRTSIDILVGPDECERVRASVPESLGAKV